MVLHHLMELSLNIGCMSSHLATNGTQISEVMAKKIEITLKMLIAVGIGVLIWEWFQIISLI